MNSILTTYALLGYLKETSSSKAAITEVYIPLVKKALADYSAEKGLTEYKGRSFSEIGEKIKTIFQIEIPLPILAKILEAISKEINDESVFALFNDGSFIIKSFIFDSFDPLIDQENDSITILERDYKTFCSVNGYSFDFQDLRSVILAQQIELFTDKRSDLLKAEFHVFKYITERLNHPDIFKIMSNIYLGGLIVSYMQQNITDKVTDTELLLDPTFFLSLIDLSTEDAHNTCEQLFSLCKQLGYRFTILNSTVNQIKVILSNKINNFANEGFIGSVRRADVFDACIRRKIDKTELEKIKDSIPQLVQKNDIDIIQDDQIKEIIEKAKKSTDYEKLNERRQNGEDTLNDIVAKYYVNNKRGQNISEFIDVKCWYLHNSFAPYDYSSSRQIHERYLISANELLVLLWLSSPAQSQQIKIDDISRSGLTSYITKSRRSKMPTCDALTIIKKRIDNAMRLGEVSEKDIFNLCIRMAEGQFTQEQAEKELIDESIPNEEFIDIIKKYSAEDDAKKEKQRIDADDKIEDLNRIIADLNKKIDDYGSEIQSVNNRLEEFTQKDYNEKKQKFIKHELRTIKIFHLIDLIIFLIILSLWITNKYYKEFLASPWSEIVSFLSFLFITFGSRLIFLDKKNIKDSFRFNKLKKQLGKEFDSNNKKFDKM